jgi:high affinity sulfate transporter 1
MKSVLIKIFPIAGWIKDYNLGIAKWDLIAGATLASFVLPESMAYASLAGVPSQYGIYCCLAGCLFFALLTESRQVAVGPTSALSLMVGTSVAVLSGGDLHRWAAIASLTALVVFVLCVAAYLLKLSGLVSFISENILLGFKTGAAFSIGVTQLPKLFGVEGGGSNFFSKVWTVLEHLPAINWTVFIFGITALTLLLTSNKLFPGRPVSLVVVILSIVAVNVAPELLSGLHLIGDIPRGLPVIDRPSLRFEDVDGILGLALGCFVMGYIETMAAARTFAEKNNYEVNPRQELLSLGAANLAAAFSSGYPVSGGMSQSTVNDKAGAKTPMALIVCSITLAVLLLYFTGLLKDLPEVILAVVVLDAVSGLVKVKELKLLYKLSKSEFFIAIIAVAGVLTFGILKGVLIACLASIFYLIARISTPAVSVLGKVKGSTQYTDIHRHPDNEEIPHCKIVRVESSLFYFNQEFVYQHVMGIVRQASEIKLLVVDMSSSPMLDVSASRMFLKLEKDLNQIGTSLRIVNALADIRDLLRKQGLENSIGRISRRVNIDQLIAEFEEGTTN